MLHLKMIRDNISSLLTKKGVQHTVMQITKGDVSYEQMLLRKLDEEIAEFRREDSVDELADVLEVLNALMELPKFKDVESLRKKKLVSHGGFTKGLILISTS